MKPGNGLSLFEPSSVSMVKLAEMMTSALPLLTIKSPASVLKSREMLLCKVKAPPTPVPSVLMTVRLLRKLVAVALSSNNASDTVPARLLVVLEVSMVKSIPTLLAENSAPLKFTSPAWFAAVALVSNVNAVSTAAIRHRFGGGVA